MHRPIGRYRRSKRRKSMTSLKLVTIAPAIALTLILISCARTVRSSQPDINIQQLANDRSVFYRPDAKKTERWGAGVVICLERGADLAQLMPLPLTVSCFSKIQIGFAFLVPAHPGSPGQRAVKRVCVCVLRLRISVIFYALNANSGR